VSAPPGIESGEVLDLLTSLVQKSLVVYEEDEAGQGRYRLLETVRQYGRDRLPENRERALLGGRHAQYFQELAEEAEPHLRGPGQKEWSSRLERELDNMRTALEWALAGNLEAAARLSGALWWFWYMRGPASEGYQWLERTLARDGAMPETRRAKALCGAGYLAGEQGDLSLARAHLEESVALWHEAGDLEGEAFSSGLLSSVVLPNDPTLAGDFSEKSVALARRSGTVWVLAFALLNRGEVERWQHDDHRAAESYTGSVTLAREAGDEWLLSMALHNLAHVRQHQRERKQAAALFQESLRLSREHGIRVGIAYGLAGLGGVEAERGEPVRAARLLGAAAELFRTVSQKMQSVDQVEFERSVAAVRARMDEAGFAAAWAAGRAMSLDQAVADALSDREAPDQDGA
jgi:non-specific serine/threonine protein kinase